MGNYGSIHNVLPRYSADDVADDRLVDAVLVRDGLLGHPRIHAADVPHVLLAQLRAAMFRAKRMPFLFNLVVRIVRSRADEQMRRVTAWRIIAMVQDVFAIRNRTVDAFVRNAMRAKLTALLVRDHAVAFFVMRSRPRPTRLWIADFVERDKTIEEWPTARSVGACARAKQGALTNDWSQLAVRAETSLGSALCAEATAALVARWVGAIWMAMSTGRRECPRPAFHRPELYHEWSL